MQLDVGEAAVLDLGATKHGYPVAAAELDTVRRLRCRWSIVVYNDDAYGAEVHYLTDGSRSTRSPSLTPTSRLSGAGTASR